MAWRGKDILTLLSAGPQLTRQIATHFGLNREQVRRACKSLQSRGLVNSLEGVHEITPEGLYALKSGQRFFSGPRAGNAQSRSHGTLRAKAWRAMQMLEVFSVSDLQTMLCDGSERYAERNLGDYVRALWLAGYLLAMPKRTKNQQQRYRMRRERYTGPQAPSFNKQTRIVTDVNTGEVVYIPTRKELEAGDGK